MGNRSSPRNDSITVTKNHGSVREGISQILMSMAAPLMSAGITPDEFAALSRAAFVNAAAATCRLRNGRVNESRIAVVTGLSRQEIARLRSQPSPPPTNLSGQRISRILAGWQSDPVFSSFGGKPNTLPFRSSTGSFAELVRRHGGDVTARAVLDEMRRLKLVRFDRKRVIPLRTQLRISDSKARLFWLIANDIAAIIRTSSLSRVPKFERRFSAQVPVNSEIETALVQQKVQSALRAAFESISSLAPGAEKPLNRSGRGKRVNVLALLEVV
jgi:hypothetical protein